MSNSENQTNDGTFRPQNAQSDNFDKTGSISYCHRESEVNKTDELVG